MEKVEKTDAEWRAELTPEQYYVMRQKGTEPAFSGALYRNHATEPTVVAPAARSYSAPTPNLNLAVAGPALPCRQTPRQ